MIDAPGYASIGWDPIRTHTHPSVGRIRRRSLGLMTNDPEYFIEALKKLSKVLETEGDQA